MIRLKNQGTPMPEKYPRVERKIPTVDEKGWVKVDGVLLRDNIDLMPQPGLQEEVCASDCNLIFMAGSATMGKGQDYNSLIYTPNGLIRMGDIIIGSKISDTEGGIQEVEQIYELGVTDLFLVKMNDGSSCRCTREHLWKYKITKRHYKCEWKINTLEELIYILDNKEKGQHIYIPLTSPVFYQQQNKLPIHPYILGVILGDGGIGSSMSSPHIHCYDNEILNRFSSLGYQVKTINKCSHRIVNKDLKQNLCDIGLWGKLSYEKFIPNEYKFASIENRIELLRGLMDTDGSVEKFHVLRYSTTSPKLAKDIQELIWSLGGICRIFNKIPHYTYKGIRKEGKLSYILNINLENSGNYITLSRKKARCKSIYRRGQTELSREIKSIEYIGKERCRCIKVSNPNRLYITDNYIVTHNTFAGFMKALEGLGSPNYTARLISKRLQDSKKGGSIIRDAKLIYDGFAGCEFTAGEYPTAMWPQWNTAIQLIHANFNTDNPSEWEEYKDYAKKSQSSYYYWDELTEIKDYKAFSYMFSRNRDNSGYGPCTVASFNPEHEHWTTEFLRLAGYIGDDYYAKPEMYGKIRYFAQKGDEITDIVWGDTREEVAKMAGLELTKEEMAGGMTVEKLVKSFTFLSGSAMSNMMLVNATKGGSVSNLYNVGETERRKLKDGYFGPSTKSSLTISSKMVESLFSNPIDSSGDMFATLDVAGGKQQIISTVKGEEKKPDNCVMWIWKGLTAIKIEIFDGTLNELVDWIKYTLNKYGIPMRNFAFDAIGIGYFLASFTDGIPIIGNSRAITEYDSAGNPITLGSYFNLRSQLMDKCAVLIETGAMTCAVDKNTIIPHGKNKTPKKLIDAMQEEKNIFMKDVKNKKLYYRSKEEYRDRFKSSSDIFDAFVNRAIFELDARPRKEAETELTEDDYAALYQTGW